MKYFVGDVVRFKGETLKVIKVMPNYLLPTTYNLKNKKCNFCNISGKDLELATAPYPKSKIIFCVLPLFCIPTNVLIRFDDCWWTKSRYDKLENVSCEKITSYPDTRQYGAILKEDSFFLPGAYKSYIKEEIIFNEKCILNS